jgi:hypothetical protein
MATPSTHAPAGVRAAPHRQAHPRTRDEPDPRQSLGNPEQQQQVRLGAVGEVGDGDGRQEGEREAGGLVAGVLAAEVDQRGVAESDPPRPIGGEDTRDPQRDRRRVHHEERPT